MPRANFILLAFVGLVAIAGCGQSATMEPEKLDRLVEEPAKPLRPVEPVEQAAFAEAVEEKPAETATVPPVLLSKQHAALCRVKVGDTMPQIALPKVLGGNAELSALYGKAATVVVFWKGDRQMALDELAELGPDVVQKFGSRGVEVVGIAVSQPAADARSVIQKTAADFPQLLDADGKAFDTVGAQRLPWTIVVDANGKIVWFDLEYSLATRRELQQALLATLR